jgi:hypothetical protein
MNDHSVIIVAAIAGITILETIALINGIDGIILSFAVGAITTLAGVKIGDVLCLRRTGG